MISNSHPQGPLALRIRRLTDAELLARYAELASHIAKHGPRRGQITTQAMTARESVTRYVVTYVNARNERTLIGPAQGRHTYETEAEAQAYLDAITANNGPDTLRQVFGDAPAFEVRPCPCYPVHFDPQTVWFD